MQESYGDIRTSSARYVSGVRGLGVLRLYAHQAAQAEPCFGGRENLNRITYSTHMYTLLP